MTIHAAKGLEFPVVVVARANQEEQDPTSRDEEPAAQLRRLFLVACSRAMRRLAVTARTDHRLPLLSGVGHQTWDVWEK